MVSRYLKGYALTATLAGQELHLYGDTVIKDQSIFAPYPPRSGDGGFRETDRTCSRWLAWRRQPVATALMPNAIAPFEATWLSTRGVHGADA